MNIDVFAIGGWRACDQVVEFHFVVQIELLGHGVAGFGAASPIGPTGPESLEPKATESLRYLKVGSWWMSRVSLPEGPRNGSARASPPPVTQCPAGTNLGAMSLESPGAATSP